MSHFRHSVRVPGTPSRIYRTMRQAAPPQRPEANRQEQFEQIKRRIHGKLVDKLDLSRVGDLQGDTLKREIRMVVEHLCDAEDTLLNRQERERIVDEVLDETFGLGPLELILKDPKVSDILINGPKNIYVEKGGQMQKTDVEFRDGKHLLQIIDRIVSKVGRRVDETCPMVDARLDDGSRVNAIIPPLALDGAAVSIRRFGSNPLRLEDLLNYRAFTPEMVMLLEGCIKARLNMIIAGGTGSGKTTLLNTLSSFIGHEDRIVTIEDAAELQLQQDHVVRLETRPPNIEGNGAVTATDLVKNALRMRPERIIIGECRGGETLDMLQAMNTGHDGSLTTIHANTPRDAIARLETLVMMSGFELPVKAIRQQVSGAVDVLIQANRLQGGPRRVTAITEVVGMEQDTIILQDIYRFNQKGINAEGKAHGQFVCSGVRPSFMDKLEAAGVRLPASAFRERVMMDA
ncbi:secretion system protein TadA [Rhodopirellula baltica SH 1]|uniref:Secretion system protein TadA n=4 Tax=Rhodopirellula baltica TaxID=265606 RepID=Q7UR21_RHOBA|nr:secretion system protein TadA [Rhodopirellula baltica SH 1]